MRSSLSTYAAAFRVFEKKALGRIFSSVRVGDDFRIRFYSELYKLLNNMDFVQRIYIKQMRWLGCALRMAEYASERFVSL